MQGKKLLELIFTLGENELQELRNTLRRSDSGRDLWYAEMIGEIVEHEADLLEPAPINIIALLQTLDPEYSNAKFARDQKSIRQVIANFLAQRGPDPHPFSGELRRARYFLHHAQHGLLEKELNELDRRIGQHPIGLDAMHASMELERVRMHVQVLNRTRKAPINFNVLQKAEDRYFVASRLKLLCARMSARNVYHDQDIQLVKEAERLVKSLKRPENVYLREDLYIQGYGRLLEGLLLVDSGEFALIMQVMPKVLGYLRELGGAEAGLPKYVMLDICTGWIGICHRSDQHVGKGGSVFLWEIYSQIFTLDLLSSAIGTDQLHHLKNYVKLSAELGKYDEAFARLRFYKNALSEAGQDLFLLLMEAMIRYYRWNEQQGDHSKVLFQLEEVIHSRRGTLKQDLFFRLQAEVFRLRVLYRLHCEGADVSEEISKAAESLKVQVFRLKGELSPEFQEGYKNFAQKFLTFLRNWWEPQEKLSRLGEKIRGVRHCVERPWLLSIIEDRIAEQSVTNR